MKFILFMLTLLLFVSCSSTPVDNWKNKQAEKIADVFTPLLVDGFDCSGEAAIHESIENGIIGLDWFNKKSVEESQNKGFIKGMIGTPMCLLVVKKGVPIVFSTIGTKVFPKKWKCKLTKIADGVGKLAEVGCNLIKF